MTTAAPTYADVPQGHYCAICDRDRTEADRFAGEMRGDDWICPDCLATEPAERIPCPHCHGEGTCMLCDDDGMVPA